MKSTQLRPAALGVVVGGVLLAVWTLWSGDAGTDRTPVGERERAAAESGQKGDPTPQTEGPEADGSPPAVQPSGEASPRAAAKELKAARATMASYVEMVSDLVSPQVTGAGAVEPVIGTDIFLDELAATAEQNRRHGVRVVGEPRIVTMRASRLDLEADPPSAVVVVCLDNSKVRIVDDNGAVVQKQAHTHTRQRFALVRPGGTWLIASQGFPANPNCG